MSVQVVLQFAQLPLLNPQRTAQLLQQLPHSALEGFAGCGCLALIQTASVRQQRRRIRDEGRCAYVSTPARQRCRFARTILAQPSAAGGQRVWQRYQDSFPCQYQASTAPMCRLRVPSRATSSYSHRGGPSKTGVAPAPWEIAPRTLAFLNHPWGSVFGGARPSFHSRLRSPFQPRSVARSKDHREIGNDRCRILPDACTACPPGCARHRCVPGSHQETAGGSELARILVRDA